MPSARTNRWLLFTILFFTYGYFFQSGQDNENARFGQVRALVEHASLHLDRSNTNSADIIEYEGKLYPNKIPGTTFLALPAWFYFSHLLKFLNLPHDIWEHAVCYFTSWFSVGILSAALGVVLFLVLEEILLSSQLAFLLTLAYGLGTIAFPFSTLFFSHQVTASLLFFSFALLFFLKNKNDSTKHIRSLLMLSGLCAGYAMTSEYPAALGTALLMGYAFWILPVRKWNAWFWLGILVGGSFLLLYNLLVSGKLYFVPYAVYSTNTHSFFPEHKIGFMGVSLPKWRTLLEITFLPQRGLFFCNPWLILLLPAMLYSFFPKPHRKEFILCAIMIVFFVIFNTAYGESIAFWGGGASVGPRHIIPMLPFGVVLIASLLDQKIYRFIFYVLGLLSIAIMLMATAVEPRVPYEYTNPIRTLFFENYLVGRLAIHPYGVFNQTLITQDSVSFNWGKLLHFPTWIQLLPLFIFWLWGTRTFLQNLQRQGSTKRNPLIPNLPARRVLAVGSVFIFVLFFIPISHAFLERHKQHEVHGLNGTYFYGSPPEFDPAETLQEWNNSNHKVAMSRLDSALNFHWVETGAPLTVPFFVEWSGFISIPEDGEYHFATISDDGSSVYINRKLVVNNWGSHSMILKDGTIKMSQGTHEIAVHYYNVGLGAGMKLYWAPPGHGLEEIPSTVLTPLNTEDLEKQ